MARKSIVLRRLKRLVAALLALVVAICFWAVVVEPRLLLDVKHYTVEIPNLPAEWEGEVIAFVADLQVGMWWDNPGMIEKAIARALEAEPAALLIAGDFVYEPNTAVVEEVTRLLQPLRDGPVPVFAVLGNHDYALMYETEQPDVEIAAQLERALGSLGIRVLQNEAVPLRLDEDGEPLYVAGIGSVWADLNDADAALAKVPNNAARILLTHNPTVFRDLPKGVAPLTLAGHTHGGQISMPGTPTHSWLNIVREGDVVVDGWASIDVGKPGNRLYVNRGIGMSTLPVRFLCRPELTLITLKNADGGLPVRAPDA